MERLKEYYNPGCGEHEITVKQILAVCGVREAIKVMYITPCVYMEDLKYMLSLAWFVLPIYEAESEEKAPVRCVTALEDFVNGKLYLEKISDYRDAIEKMPTKSLSAKALSAAKACMCLNVVRSSTYVVNATGGNWEILRELLMKHLEKNEG